ncbi:MAG: UDP-N-acetylmuramoyl-L-alanine--D-glutamate ligase [Deltaproteobacteria bacterium]|jgi:UDP-N-acetylmuramoylalanine--D-glutamate ligase|nr:UDP-N-acetylmuramoyl-L-alanine--D-glutamate ligase [Deltaproteobacteria bacterium]
MVLESESRILPDSPVKRGELAVVVGGGVSGLAAAALLRRLGARVRLLDNRPEGLEAETLSKAAALDLEFIAGPHRPEQFRGAALVVPSPGVPVRKLEALLSEAGNPPCISELELASSFAHEDIIAVTGTSGKTTTVSLIAAMLEKAGKKVFLGGNIGTPLSAYILQREEKGGAADVLVLETSSFQLQLTRAFHPRTAVLLNLSENHLDQHRDMEEYRAAKLRIFANQTRLDLAILGDPLFSLLRDYPLRARREYFAPSGRFRRTRLLGRHNQANLEAAFLAAQAFGTTLEEAVAVAAAFSPLPHRLESVGEWSEILYVDDSKATTVEALRVALRSLERPLFLLAGGVFKGGDLESLRPLLRERVKAVALFGGSREIFETAWREAVPLSWDADLESAVRRVRSKAAPGDAILLAPATSSFDLYADYKARGNDFKRIAELLK